MTFADPTVRTGVPSRRTKLLYWTITGLYALLLLMSGIIEVMQHKFGREITHAYAGDSTALIAAPLIFLALSAVSYLP